MIWELILLAELLQSAFLPLWVLSGPLPARGAPWVRRGMLAAVGLFSVLLWRQICAVPRGAGQMQVSAFVWVLQVLLLFWACMLLFGGTWQTRVPLCCVAISACTILTSLPWLLYSMLLGLDPAGSYTAVWEMLTAPWHYCFIFASYLLLAWGTRVLLTHYCAMFPRAGAIRRTFAVCGCVLTALLTLSSIATLHHVAHHNDVFLWRFFAQDCAVLCLILLGFAILLDALEKHQLRMDMLRLEEEKERQSQQYNRRLDAEESIFALQHDLRKHMRVLRADLQDGRTADALAYLSLLADEQDRVLTLMPYTGNRAADLLLSEAAQRCRAANVLFHVQGTLPDPPPLADNDIICLLGNLLDNAVKAAAEVPDGSIELSLCRRAGQLLIRCSNSSPAPPPHVARQPGPHPHGYGLRIMEQLVAAHGGIFEHHWAAGRYQLSILLPLPEAAPAVFSDGRTE